MPLGLAMVYNMRAELCVRPLENAYHSYPGMRGMIIHSDRGSQYKVLIIGMLLKIRHCSKYELLVVDVITMLDVKVRGQE